MKTANIFLSILFLFAAVLQYNDPDPLQWIFIYGLSALTCGLFAWKSGPLILPAITGVVSFIWMIFLFVVLQGAPDAIIWADVFGEASMKTESVELTREILGLFIIFVWMTVLIYKVKKNS